MLDKLTYSVLIVEALESHQCNESRELMLSDLIANLSDALAEAQVKLAEVENAN